jgi:phage repressor protein C with HTH and peptisase S24 domain
MVDLKQILDRVDAIQAPRNLSDRKLSLMAGMSGDVIRNWKRRVKAGDEDAGANRRSLEAVARALGVSSHWLITGEGARSASDALEYAANLERTPETESWRRIPCYDMEASAGDGALVGIGNALFDIGFSEAMLREITSAPPERLAFFRVRGDSMLPTLQSRDWILVDATSRTMGPDGMFLLRTEDLLIVKRIQPVRDGYVRVLSDNPSVPPYEVDAKEMEVMGRIAWIGRRV